MIKYLLPILLLAGCHQQGDVVVYNCSLAEVSPDMPIKAKEECRHIRSFKNQKNNQMVDGCVYQESRGKVIKTCG